MGAKISGTELALAKLLAYDIAVSEVLGAVGKNPFWV